MSDEKFYFKATCVQVIYYEVDPNDASLASEYVAALQDCGLEDRLTRNSHGEYVLDNPQLLAEVDKRDLEEGKMELSDLSSDAPKRAFHIEVIDKATYEARN